MARISIRPVGASLDQTVTIEVSDVSPGSRVRVRLRNDSLKAEANAEFVANDRGVVNVDEHPAIAGDCTATMSVDGGEDVSTTFHRRLIAANVVQTPVHEGRIRGTLFAQNGGAVGGIPGRERGQASARISVVDIILV